MLIIFRTTNHRVISMPGLRTIRILEVDPNKRGDLFARLASDVFFSLGYENLRFNIQKSGRELDVEGVHRAERRRLNAECKATSEKVGGDEVNKFIGGVDAERRRRADSPISPYFLSLAGYTETAIEQEKEVDPPRITLMDAHDVITELVNGRIVCSERDAAARAGQCASNLGLDVRLEKKVELLAHQLGWVWCLRFEQGKKTTHFSLIHADGQRLARAAAQSVVDSDASIGGDLKNLNYLASPHDQQTRLELENAARERYFNYLAADFGQIELTGLPADQDVGSRRLRLESIFVPLHVVRQGPSHEWVTLLGTQQKVFQNLYTHDFVLDSQVVGVAKTWTDISTGLKLPFWNATPYDDRFLFPPPTQVISFADTYKSVEWNFDELLVKSITPISGKIVTLHGDFGKKSTVGEVLTKSRRLAILAPPGGGKSTLLKRLATAYAFPQRVDSINDQLPKRPLFPIIFRCRQLSESVNASILEISASISNRAEMDGDLVEAFAGLTSEAFRAGNALLLVDGLDEISNETARLRFANQLRIFLAIYPQVSVVVTSREAGFRTVSGALGSSCDIYTLAELDDDDIKRLTLAWHKEVLGDRAEVASEATLLAETICSTDRVRELAKNPLLLTTLLLVKRWIGQLPTRRSVLYGKAIEVLLMTWNVEGHEPLDQEEVIPQLAYVAHVMMQEGIQRITSRRLQELLTAARQQMPEVLAFTKLSVSEFIDRVELRSSLLIQSGHEVEDGTLYPVYEFRHLTFQEYLTAVAVKEGYYPNRAEQDTLLTTLEPHLLDERWKEIIPLVAVLSGRRVQPLLQKLVKLADDFSYDEMATETTSPVILLGECIADECSIAPELLTNALDTIARRAPSSKGVISRLLSSKYKEIFQELVRKKFTNAERGLFSYAEAYMGTAEGGTANKGLYTADLFDRIEEFLKSEDTSKNSLGALLIMRIGLGVATRQMKLNAKENETLLRFGDLLPPLLFSGAAHLQFSAAWALTWLVNARIWSPSRNAKVLRRLTDLWINSKVPDVRFVAAWALSRFPLLRQGARPLGESDEATIAFLKNVGHSSEQGWAAHDFTTSCVVSYYLNAPWSGKELEKRFEEAYKEIPGARPTKAD